jgi:hypothetical protein
VVFVLVAPNEPKEDKWGDKNKGQTEADEVDSGHNVID